MSQRLGCLGAPLVLEASLVYLHARYYAPAVYRVLQRDSRFGTTTHPVPLHRYAYAHHNPLAYHDPTGHDPWWNDPDFATPLNWGCGPYFPGCLFGLGGMNDLAWTLDAGFTPWLTGGLSPSPAPGRSSLWMSYGGWQIHQDVLARLQSRIAVGPLAGALMPQDLPPLLTAPGARYYFDARTSNINALPFMDTLPSGSHFRITLALDRPAIISVGLVRDRNFRRYLHTGTWVPLEIGPLGIP